MKNNKQNLKSPNGDFFSKHIKNDSEFYFFDAEEAKRLLSIIVESKNNSSNPTIFDDIKMGFFENVKPNEYIPL